MGPEAVGPLLGQVHVLILSGTNQHSDKLPLCLYFRPHDGSTRDVSVTTTLTASLTLTESRPLSELCFLLSIMGSRPVKG